MGAALALVLIAASSAEAATYKPTRFDDPRPGQCKERNCSLREAISKARSHPGKDKIVLRTGTYDIARPETPADDNAGGDFDLKGAIRVTGKGAGMTIVDGNGVSGVFSILGDAPKTLEKLTVTGGSADAGAGVFVGPAGSNFIETTQKLRRLVIEANVAGTSGGGIHTSSQVVGVSRVTLRANHAPLGGGIYVASAATSPSGTPPLKIIASTLSSNTAALGGGLYLDGQNPAGLDRDPRASVDNSTFSNNVATVSGGGIAAILGAQLDASHVTVAYNGADSDGSGGGIGGGIYQSSDASFSIEQALVKENAVGASGDGPQCGGAFRFQGVITPQGGSSCSFTGGSIIQGETQLRIGVLADNGGPTQTIEILSDSLANGFVDSCFLTKDQRGVARPAADCDAGAYERP